MFFVGLLIIFIISKWYKAEQQVASKEHFKNELANLGPASKQEKYALLLLIVLIIALLTNKWHGIDGSIFFMSLPAFSILTLFWL